jgi:hypothetical protein
MDERNGAAHRIVTTKKQDQSAHHQVTNAPNSREMVAAYQGPVRPIETQVHPRNLQDTNALDYLNTQGEAAAARYNKAHEEYFRKHGHGI